MLRTKILCGGVSEQSLEDRLYVMFADESKLIKIIQQTPAAQCLEDKTLPFSTSIAA